MTRLLWDQVGERRYEAGCDRGVLYLPEGSPVVWNGLTSVEEDLGDVTVDSYYLDGVKYLDSRNLGDYSGTLKALTYPDEFLQFDGFQEFEEGLFATSQPVKETFGLSYRTKVGDDVSGLDLGYKLHVLYNLTAQPDNRSFSTLNASATSEEFSWKLTGIPIAIPGMRPAVHIVVDSTKVGAGSMENIENYLYGTESAPGSLPDAATLVELYADIIEDPIAELI